MRITVGGWGEYNWTPFSSGPYAQAVWALIESLEAFIDGGPS